MNNLHYVLHVADPIHGLIGVTEIERKIIDSPAFQRLRKIKQLGNVHLLFPNAVHTRFTHSIGVMHTASLLFSALMKKISREHQSKEFFDAIDHVHQTVRIAGLLHDIGHGPLSHHFEECLRTYDKSKNEFNELTFGKWSGDLKISDDWIKTTSINDFNAHKLEHEHFSFGVIARLGGDLSFDAQGVCSLLSNDIECSQQLNEDLKEIAGCFGERGNFSESLRMVLKSILSGDIDADRLDYLKRDSYFCGTSIAAIDINHLLSSMSLGFKEGDFFIEISRNAIPVVESILISRKQMFNQIYNHRINASFDYLMSRVIDYLIISGEVSVPTSYAKFLSLTDSFLEDILNNLITDCSIPTTEVNQSPGNQMGFQELANICAKFYVTRTPLIRIYEEDVKQNDKDAKVFDLKKTYGDKVLVVPLSLKTFYKQSKSSQSLIRIKPRSKDLGHTPLSETSDVLSSPLWQENKVRIVVYEGYLTSASNRSLQDKLLHRATTEIAKLAPGEIP